MALAWTERYGVHQAFVGSLFLISVGHVGSAYVVTIYLDGGRGQREMPGMFLELDDAKRSAVAYLRGMLSAALRELK